MKWLFFGQYFLGKKPIILQRKQVKKEWTLISLKYPSDTSPTNINGLPMGKTTT